MKSKTKAPMLLEFTCSQRWQEMTGDERARHCVQCDQQVINISDYSQAQINELQERIDCGEKICVAFKPVKAEPVDVLGEWLSFAFPESSLGISGLLACSLTLGSCSLLALSASPARAQNGQKQESPRKGPLVPSAQKNLGFQVAPLPSQKPPEAKPGQNAYSDVMLAPSEYALMAGRPAPSFLRDTVTELMYGRDDFFNFLPMILRFNIRQQVEREGSINIPQIEWMASLQEFQGQPGEALNSYQLLHALADRQQTSGGRKKERKAALWKKIEALAPVAYRSYLKEIDKGSENETQIQELFAKAQEIRTLSPSIMKLCPWGEFASRIDRIAGGSNSVSFASLALAVSSGEPKAPALTIWRKKYIDVLVRYFNERLEKAEKELVNGRLTDASQMNASLYLPVDQEAAALCDADGLFLVRLKLVPYLNDEPRFSCLMECIHFLRNPAYHPHDNKYKNQLSGLVVAEIKKRMALGRDAMNRGERVQVIWRLWEAQGLIKALPEAIPANLLKKVKEWRRELKLKPDEEGPFK